MSLNAGTIKDRICEVFDGFTQDEVADTLHISQSAVSKLRSGQQLPTTDQLINIADTYNVSVDWLLGRSDVKNIETSNELSYAAAVEALIDLKGNGAIDAADKKENRSGINFSVKDPLLEKLLSKGLRLYDADYLSFQTWVNDRLSIFKGKRVLWSGAWNSVNRGYAINEAKDEKDLLDIFQTADDEQTAYEESIKDD